MTQQSYASKHDVLYEVAKLAWNGELDEEHKAQVPYHHHTGTAGTVPLLYL